MDRQTQNMGHIIKDDRFGMHSRNHLSKLFERLPINHHALSQNDQLRFVEFQEFLRLFKINLVRVIFKNREFNGSCPFHQRINSNKVSQGTHGLGTEMPSPGKMVVHHLPDSAGVFLSIKPVEIVHQTTEDSHIGHLAADHPRLHF